MDSLVVEESDALNVFDRGYVDYKKLDSYCEKGIRFVTRLKGNAVIEVVTLLQTKLYRGRKPIANSTNCLLLLLKLKNGYRGSLLNIKRIVCNCLCELIDSFSGCIHQLYIFCKRSVSLLEVDFQFSVFTFMQRQCCEVEKSAKKKTQPSTANPIMRHPFYLPFRKTAQTVIIPFTLNYI